MSSSGLVDLAASRLSRLSIALRSPTRLPLLTRSSSSGSRWKQRQGRDAYARDAKVQGLKSRAAFKLLEMDAKYRLFKGGQTVVDLGYAPGSWSQVALERTQPHGRVIGIDLIPAQPPRGVATFQGDFLSPVVQKLVKDFIIQAHPNPSLLKRRDDDARNGISSATDEPIDQPSYIDMERRTGHTLGLPSASMTQHSSTTGLVDIVLSDMLMNTSGVAFRDHAGSMDLCAAALRFANDTLKPGGHFICKFYQGSEDKELEQKLKKLFAKVYREKPESSRNESKEAYFVALRRKPQVVLSEVDDDTAPTG